MNESLFHIAERLARCTISIELTQQVLMRCYVKLNN